MTRNNVKSEMDKLLQIFQPFVDLKCPSCKLFIDNKDKLLVCPKCSRDVCINCVAIDKTDCMFCGMKL